MAGILRKYRGKFILGRQWKKSLASRDSSPLYLAMLRAFLVKFNWAFSWGADEIPFIQQAFLYSFYLMTLDGAEFRPAEHYAAAFLKAFPDVPADLEEAPLLPREERFASTYVLQTIWGLMRLFGLVEIEVDEAAARGMGTVRKTPLLEELVSFNI